MNAFANDDADVTSPPRQHAEAVNETARNGMFFMSRLSTYIPPRLGVWMQGVDTWR
jgi:hypothetical protein